jgi:hypothetical protein
VQKSSFQHFVQLSLVSCQTFTISTYLFGFVSRQRAHEHEQEIIFQPDKGELGALEKIC